MGTLGNKNSRIALGFFGVAFVLIFISFASPYWLVSDGKLEKPKFLNLGKSSRTRHARQSAIVNGVSRVFYVCMCVCVLTFGRVHDRDQN